MKFGIFFLGLLSICFAVDAIGASRCETLFLENSESVVRELAHLYVQSGNDPQGKLLFNIYQKKMTAAQAAGLDLSSLPIFVEEIRRENKSLRQTEDERKKKIKDEENKILKNYRWRRGVLLADQKDGNDGVFMSFDFQDSVLATHQRRRSVMIRDPRDGSTKVTLQVPATTSDNISQVQVLAEGKTVVAFMADNFVVTWDLTGQKPVESYKLPEDPDSTFFYDKALNHRGDMMVRIHNINREKKMLLTDKKGKILRELELEYKSIHNASFSADDNWLIITSVDGPPVVWNLHTYERKLLEGQHTGRIWSGELSADGSVALTADEFGLVTLWDLKNDMILRHVRLGEKPNVALSPDGRKFAIGIKSEISVWDVASGVKITDLVPFEARQSYQSYWNISFSPDSKRIFAGGSSGLLSFWAEQDEL